MEKNVCIIRSNPVNPDSRVEKEAKSLKKRGYNVHILAWDREENHIARNEVIRVDNLEIPITRIGCKASYGEGMKNIISYVKFQMSMREWLKKNSQNIDIIHACDFDTAFFSIGVAKRKKKKFVFDIFDFLYSKPQNIIQKIVQLAQIQIINYSDGTIICTEDRLKQIKGSKPKRIAIVHNSPENKIVANDKENSEQPITIVYVGILQDYRLLKEITEVIGNKSNIRFMVAGFGKYEKFFHESSRKYPNVNFLGKISYADTITLESKADIMLAVYDPKIDNHIYAAPNKFYEALMLGKPLIMVKNTGMSSFVKNEDIGQLIEYSKEGFEEGLNLLINRKDEWKNMSNKMKKLYEKKFSWSIMEKRLYHLYDTIIEENS